MLRDELRGLKTYWRAHGGAYTLRRGMEKTVQRVTGSYDRVWRKEQPSAETLAFQQEHPPAAGLISVLIPVYNTDSGLLSALLDSLKVQTYADWEAILYDGHSDRAETLALLDAAGAEDPRFQVVHAAENQGIAGNTNAALSHARGEYVALCDHDDLLSPEALWRMAERIARDHPDLLYSDEDRVMQNGLHRLDPHWKPDYGQVTLLNTNYFCHLSLIRRELMEAVGGLRAGFEGSQDFDFFLRVAERTENIAHVPFTLYSWRDVASSASHRNLMDCLDNAARAVEEHGQRIGLNISAAPVNKELRLWIDTPREATVEALIVGNSEEACREGLAELDVCTDYPSLSAALLVTESEDMYALVNEAAEGSRADYLLLMDARLRGMNRHFLRELMMYAQLPSVSAVTPVLVDGRNRITHGGFVLGMEGVAQCVNEGLYRTAGGWHNTMNRAHNVLAVSPCCALIRREAFIPFDEGYRGALGMADWGLRQWREHRRLAAFTPHAVAVMERDPLLLSGTARDERDVLRFYEAHPEPVQDPCYSARFDRKRASYRILTRPEQYL